MISKKHLDRMDERHENTCPCRDLPMGSTQKCVVALLLQDAYDVREALSKRDKQIAELAAPRCPWCNGVILASGPRWFNAQDLQFCTSSCRTNWDNEYAEEDD